MIRRWIESHGDPLNGRAQYLLIGACPCTKALDVIDADTDDDVDVAEAAGGAGPMGRRRQCHKGGGACYCGPWELCWSLLQLDGSHYPHGALLSG